MFKGVKEIKVAGVTFNNQDGTSRQELLRKFDAVDEVAVSLLEHEHKGKPAFHVLVDGEIIGNIPRDKTQFILDNRDGIGFDDIEIAIYRAKDGENFAATVYIPYEAPYEWIDEVSDEEYELDDKKTYQHQPSYDRYERYEQPYNNPAAPKPFYASTWFNVLLILFVTPLGLITMWAFTDWKKTTKTIVTILCIGALVMNYFMMMQLATQLPSMGKI